MSIHTIGILVIVLGLINLTRIALFLVGSDIYNLKLHLRKRRESTGRRLPTFTVVIPAHNEENTIVNCVKSVFANDYPSHLLQVLVADDGSSDKTKQLVSNYKQKNNLINLQIITRPRGGKAQALNFALRNFARGELVMCLDADSTIDPDAIKNAVGHFSDPRIAALAANIKICDNGSLLGLIQIFEYIICYQMKRSQTIFNVEYIIGGIGSTFRHSALKKVGYYDTDTITEDIDLTMKIIKTGNKKMRAAYGSDVIAHTEPVESIRSLIRQRYRWKYGRCQTFWKNRSLFFNTNKKYSKLLTCGYLPLAIFFDLTFFLEPLLVSYILFLVLRYQDLWTIVSALIVVTTYIAFNILSEDAIPWRKKPILLLIAPTMYFLFYTLSFVEYIALIQSLFRLHKIPASIRQGLCTWTHVERSAKA